MTDANDDDERILDRFRNWLEETRIERALLNGACHDAETETEAEPAGTGEIGLNRLLEEFTALRHELKLQTRSARGLEDQTQALLSGMREAVDALRSIEPKEAQAAWSAAKPLAVALADLDEALERGKQQVERIANRLVECGADEMPADLAELAKKGSWFRRRFARDIVERAWSRVQSREQEAREERRSLLAALQEGYALVQARLARALAEAGISRIATAEQPVDPETMVVLEAVEAPGRPAGIVLEEIRRGYTFKGRLLRCAEVRASRS